MAKRSHHPRGGARPGSGPKPGPEGKAEKISVTVPGELLARLDELAGEKEWTRSQAITEAIRRLVKSRR